MLLHAKLKVVMAAVKLVVACLLCMVAACLVGGGDGQLRFMVIGDWGGQPTYPYTTDAEREVAVQMGKTAAEIGSQFTVALGDNFYHFGVTNVDDPRFQETFEKVFTAPALQSRWYVVCGNHDHYGNASAEVAYTKRSTRWYMPELYYTEILSVPGTATTVQLVMIDTVELAGLTDPYVRSRPPPGPASLSRAVTQWEWIEKILASSKADWIIMGGHYPVWSVAEHGPTEILVQQLRPLLQKYNVSSYFCGHDHNLQHIKENSSQVNYFVAGAGHLTNPSVEHMNDIPPNSLKFHYGVLDLFHDKGGYTSVFVSTDKMTVIFYDYTGAELYNTTSSRVRNIY